MRINNRIMPIILLVRRIIIPSGKPSIVKLKDMVKNAQGLSIIGCNKPKTITIIKP
jgi:hypothetical protein